MCSFVLYFSHVRQVTGQLFSNLEVPLFCFSQYGITVRDFGRSWRDGVAFCALVHRHVPEEVDMTLVRTRPARVNLTQAFDLADSRLGIPRLLEPAGRCLSWLAFSSLFGASVAIL